MKLKAAEEGLPVVHDPFSGGGTIPLEAQRLGLSAYGSDLNPVAVMIGKGMIEIPPLFRNAPPIHPGAKKQSSYRPILRVLLKMSNFTESGCVKLPQSNWSSLKLKFLWALKVNKDIKRRDFMDMG